MIIDLFVILTEKMTKCVILAMKSEMENNGIYLVVCSIHKQRTELAFRRHYNLLCRATLGISLVLQPHCQFCTLNEEFETIDKNAKLKTP